MDHIRAGQSRGGGCRGLSCRSLGYTTDGRAFLSGGAGSGGYRAAATSVGWRSYGIRRADRRARGRSGTDRLCIETRQPPFTWLEQLYGHLHACPSGRYALLRTYVRFGSRRRMPPSVKMHGCLSVCTRFVTRCTSSSSSTRTNGHHRLGPFPATAHIHQLALTYKVYPGATHKRFEHSLGVMDSPAGSTT